MTRELFYVEDCGARLDCTETNAHNGTAVLETLPSWNAFFKKYVLIAEAVNYFSLSFGTPKLKNVH